MAVTWRQLAGRKEPLHQMQYHEREELKQFAGECLEDGDADSAAHMLILIAHWMREDSDVPFLKYARHWLELEVEQGEVGLDTPLLMRCFGDG